LHDFLSSARRAPRRESLGPRVPTRRVRELLAPTLLAAGLVACGGEAHPPRPNVLLVTIDTLRADRCSVYGYEQRTTPRLEELAAGGVLVEQAYAPMATTAPSHAAVLTGRFPLQLGLLQNGAELRAEELTLAERLRELGYRTAAFVSAFPVHSKFGFDQGFESYDEPTENERLAPDTLGRATRWFDEWKSGSERPFFVWTHLFDPHSPYRPPAKHREKFLPEGATRQQREAWLSAGYDGEIHFTDRSLGQLFDHLRAIGAWENTLVIVTADHGEGLGDHGEHQGHGLFVYEEAVRVPLLFHWPGRLPAGRRVAGPVSTVEIEPTLLALLGVPDETAAIGRDLGAALRGEADLDPAHPIHTQRRSYLSEVVRDQEVKGFKFGLRVGSWKYIEALEEGTVELYDLALDPHETVNVAADHPEAVESLGRHVREWVQEHALGGGESRLSEEDLERLEALGYTR